MNILDGEPSDLERYKKKLMSELSIVIPCFNEKSNIHEIVKQIDLINTKNTDLKIEFILVNNGSTDGTLEKLLFYKRS